MKSKNSKTHVVDFLFTIALFFVFAVSSVTVVLISSNSYRSIASQTEENHTTRTALSYLSQKIRQNDVGGSISLGKLGDTDALVMKQTVNNDTYTTYIYAHLGELKELFIKDGASASPHDGNAILKVSFFSMEQINPHLFRFIAVDEAGARCELLVGPRT